MLDVAFLFVYFKQRTNYQLYADMAELVDATDLKSVGTLLPCRFDSGFPHHKINIHLLVGVFLWLG